MHCQWFWNFGNSFWKQFMHWDNTVLDPGEHRSKSCQLRLKDKDACVLDEDLVTHLVTHVMSYSAPVQFLSSVQCKLIVSGSDNTILDPEVRHRPYFSIIFHFSQIPNSSNFPDPVIVGFVLVDSDYFLNLFFRLFVFSYYSSPKC